MHERMMPEERKPKTPHIENKKLAKVYLDILDKKYWEVRNKITQSEKYLNELYDEYTARRSHLEQEYPELHELKIQLKKEDDRTWHEYRETQKNYGETDPYTLQRYQIWSQAYHSFSNTDEQLEKLIKTNHPEDWEQVEKIRKTWVLQSETRTSLLEEDHKAYDAWNEALEIYKQFKKEKYEKKVNAYLESIRAYQEKRTEKLHTKLTKGLVSLGNTNPETLARGKKLLQASTQTLESLAGLTKHWMVYTATWIFAVSALSYFAQKENKEKVDNYISENVDRLYESVSTAPHDSITNVIFHNIAGTETLPEEWRHFLAKEDSTEFGSSESRETFVQEGNQEEISERDAKLRYITLWKMNEAHGNPLAQYGQHEGDKDRASFSSWINTMNLPTYHGKFELDDYLAELAHAEQLSKDPKKYAAWKDTDKERTDSIARAEGITYHDAQLRTYKNPITLEYDAHSVIEPKLEEEFEKKKEELQKGFLEQ